MKSSAIAIVGMAGRFPGARNIREFWQNLRDGVESIRSLTDEELLAAGVSPEELASPDYVKRASILDDVSMFDAAFFGFSPRDASIMDPQHRHFLECAWEALEDAAHPPQSFNGSIGVFAGSGMNTYLIHNLLANRKLLETAGLFQLKQTGNDKDVLATRVSYQLDLRGPSINIQTACSTSLVATHLACQALLNFECDMALAGGVTIEIPHGQGYIYRDGEILSRDGHCRSFDASSSGTVFSSGLGIVVLRRLEDALADHDDIRAVILGSAVNNDGARKVGYLAPSVEGQAEVIAEALDFAGVTAEDISYVETHGTGTVVGDPIEIRALTQAFRKSATRNAYCGIGSLKTNVGHLDAAAGVSALIKTTLALQHAQIPASLHFEKPNPHLDLKSSPFYVNNKLADWPSTGQPRRAGVTSLGIGGTNAHVVLEEAPKVVLAGESRPYQLLTVSAKTPAAADRAFANLTAHLGAHPELNLADVAFTCQVGRQAFAHRRALVVEDTPDARAALATGAQGKPASGTAATTAPRVVFMFSGQGSQYVNMGRELYHHEPVFREALDLCAEHLLEPLGLDLRKVIFQDQEPVSEELNQTWLTQPALFSIEYALARWWMSLGLEPAAMVGHSIGEYVAACLAGVFSLQDALAIVAFRGRLMADLPSGSMLAVPLAPGDLHLNGSLSLAAVNNPGLCVVSGPTPAIAALEQKLQTQSIPARRLVTSHAFHSAMMDPILKVFEERLRTISFHAPSIPYLSNLTGTWIKADEATDPAYWSRHLRSTVRFSDNLAELLQQPDQVLIEIGPGNVLTSLARQQGGAAARAFQTLPHPREKVPALRCAMQTLGQLWTLGVNVDWTRLNSPGFVQRVSLPTYPFEHLKFWIEADRTRAEIALPAAPGSESTSDLSFYRRVWKAAPATPSPVNPKENWLIFTDSLGLGDRIASRLAESKQSVTLVSAGPSYKQDKRGKYTIRPSLRADYDTLIADLIKTGHKPTHILHLWSITEQQAAPSLEETIDRSFYSPLYLAQALAAQDMSNIGIALISNCLQQVADEPVHNPARAVLLGPARVIPKELPGIQCRSIDVDLRADNGTEFAAQIVTEMGSAFDYSTIAWRHGERFAESLDSFNLAAAPERRRLVPRGVYLITGGLGGLGLVIAEHLAREFNARIVLIGRSSLPPESEWEDALKNPLLSETSRQRIRKLLEIRAVSGGLLVAQADVTDVDSLRSVVSLARQHYGKIDGVFHAAGVLDDGPLMLKTPQSAASVLHPKVQGTLALEEALRGEQLGCFVLFSSISSIVSPTGQVDYAAANAFLDAFAVSRKGPVTVVNWGLWRDVGMGARSASTHPWLEQLLLDTPNEVVFAGEFSEASRWVLSEHKLTGGSALIPGTGHLEMVTSAFTRGSLRGAVEIRDAQFLTPAMFESTESKQVRVQLQREHEDRNRAVFRFSVFSGPAFAPAHEWVENAAGEIGPCQSAPPSNVDRDAILARCNLGELIFDEEHLRKQESDFNFGPRWRSLRRIWLGDGEAVAEIELDQRFAGDLEKLHLHPALLDMATGAALYLTEEYEKSTELFLPIAYKKVRLYHPLPARMFSYIRPRDENSSRGEVVTFDLTIFDEQNEVLAEIEGFAMRRIPHDLAESLRQNRQATGVSHAGSEHLIQIATRPAISPQEGARTLTRILQSRTPVAVVAVPEPLHREKIQAAAPVTSASSPKQDNTDGSIEATLTAWWQDLLGVEQVSPDDDFFALGGHSLIGVRLFAKIRKTYRSDLEMAVLFEARTIRQLADVIRKSRQPVPATQRNWISLVPIQTKGSRIPFFGIHGAGGDVLFYQPLSNALGDDQPFYAFKSPLIASDQIRPTTVEELATLYLQEMRAFYPQGPYLLGGTSFGGMVALDMAQQLRAQGIEVGLLLMLDTSVPGSEVKVETKGKVDAFWKQLRSQGLGYLMRKLSEKREYAGYVVRDRSRKLTGVLCRITGRPLPLGTRYFLAEQEHLRAMYAYVAKPYAGKVTLIRALDRGMEALGRREDPLLGWGEVAQGGLEIHDVTPLHTLMLIEPHVGPFAELLKTLLPSEAHHSSAR